MNDIEVKLREILLPVLGLDDVDDVDPQHALVNDLGADSLDFVEIVFLVEKNFGVSIETKELLSGGVKDAGDSVFTDGKLTEDGLELVRENIPENPLRFSVGMTKVEIFRQITVRDLAILIARRKNGGA